tara:strand:- start:69 stop:551 length:483 start_codon:yes stop_codon:yes gene_type:complete
MSFVPIIMGSKSDLKHGTAISDALTKLGVASEIRIASAHKAPLFLLELLSGYEDRDDAIVYITVAGRSNALSALVDAQVTSPVLACPPYSERYAGADVFSSLSMPSGVAPAVVLDPKGAALVAAKIFAIAEPGLIANIEKAHKSMSEQILIDDAELRNQQ